MLHAFPEDELRPITCGPLTRDRENPAHIELNDALGNYSLTLIDSLSTLAILASSPAERDSLRDFEDGIAKVVEFYGDGTRGSKGQGLRARGFDLDSKVQVFETVIRGVGGLLSAHQFAVGHLPIRGYGATGRFTNGMVYDGQLLRLAQDLAERLLPAFHTPTGLPYPRVNLRTGIPFYANSIHNTDPEHGVCPSTPVPLAEITETCTAGAGSLVLEFSTLSRLTGDERFEEAAKDAFWAVWEHKSSIGLVGSGIDAETGQWISPYTGIGAGIDSFFEYAFKSHVLLGTEDFLVAWQSLHEAIHRHVYRGDVFQHPHYIQADLFTGAVKAFWIDSLSAYYPGLLTLAGELDEAIAAHLLYTALWTRYSALPERWSTATGEVEMGLRWWGGRPEFIESTWYLYQATRDPWYRHVGEMALRDIKRRCWTRCGWAGIQDVRTGELTDRMESFFLGETAKYLFLLFDEHHPLNYLDAPWVFTTEGHPLIIPKRYRKPSEHGELSPTCPVPPPALPLSISATAARPDIFHAASLARLTLEPSFDTSSPLMEFTADHPSISIADIQSPTNYSYYPWTLPAELIPAKGFSNKMAHRPTFDLTFPNMPDSIPSISSLRRTGGGILVGSISGLRLGMIRDRNLYRIHAVSNVFLGRDEKVFLKRETVSDFNPVDPFFTRSRDTSHIDLVLDFLPLAQPTNVDTTLNSTIPTLDVLQLEDQDPSFISSILGNIQNMISNPGGSLPLHEMSLQRTDLPASLSIGPGAAPLPDIPDAPAALSEGPESALTWSAIYVADDDLCQDVLPAHVVKTTQILVVRRGGCSFSTKLQHIPVVPPSPSSVQLVVVVSFPHHEVEDARAADQKRTAEPGVKKERADAWIQPLLDSPQLTPKGLPRQNPLPMIMIAGGQDTMALFQSAKGVGVRRRFWFSTQGVRIENLIVL